MARQESTQFSKFSGCINGEVLRPPPAGSGSHVFTTATLLGCGVARLGVRESDRFATKSALSAVVQTALFVARITPHTPPTGRGRQ